jgi:ATP-binding cassette, subfamily F, member 3
MSFISVIDLSYQAGTKKLFDGLSFSIQSGDRIGLVGHNGCGKSTLLKLLLEQLDIDSGQLHLQRGLKIGLVEQFLPEVLESIPAHEAVLQCIPQDERVVRAYQVDTLLTSLGFSSALVQQPLKTMSGGQKNLVLLARAIIREPELLLLDEPGNHMDSRALVFLKRYLQSADAPAFLMISHDRDLLDSVTQRTLWLRDERCYSFDLPYSSARQALAELDEAAEKARQTEEKQIDKLKVSAKRLATWGKVYDNEDLSRKAKTMEKRIDRLEAEKTFVSKGSCLTLKVDAELLKAKQLFAVDKATVNTPDQRTLFKVDYLTFRPGDRIALLGVNGCGKSTFIESLIHYSAQEADASQAIRFNPNVRIGYFDQELTQFDSGIAILDWVLTHCRANEEEVKRSLIQWGFAYNDQSRSVSVLSGGERARLLLLTFQLDQPNLLVMDEPTNHIDLQGKESLEGDLLQNGISLLFTSHDQRFIQTVANRFWWIHNGQMHELHDPDEYFNSLQEMDLAGGSQTVATHKNIVSVDDQMSHDEEEVLARIVELETLLEQDQARKAKFQKPERQKEWSAEIDRLYRQIE